MFNIFLEFFILYDMIIEKYKGCVPMTVGKRIKRIREFRKITQKELGLALGYPENSATVRIAQYEANTRIPKKETAIEIAKILQCNYVAIYDDDLDSVEQVMETLFWLDDSCFFKLFNFQKLYNSNEPWVFKASYNDYNYMQSFPPIGISISYGLVNDFMREWLTRQKELENKEISEEEYFDWKINWPHSCDDNGKFEPSYQWRKNVKNND